MVRLAEKLTDMEVRESFVEWVGKEFPVCGKQVVVDEAAGVVGQRFGKMSGVLRWSNGAFLWVNLDGGAYDNPFVKRRGKVYFTFYAATRTTPDSTLHKALVNTEPGWNVYLLVRPSPSDPYTLYGKVECKKFDVDAAPIEYNFELVDSGVGGRLVSRKRKK